MIPAELAQSKSTFGFLETSDLFVSFDLQVF